MAKPEVEGGLLDQHKLMVAVNLSEWATRLDTKVATVVIEKYMRAHKNARVSLRFLEQATGATRPNIITSVRHLCTNGALSVLREGRGTRPTEYRLNFDYRDKTSSGIADDTSTSGIVHDTSCGIAHDTSSASSGIADDTESYLPSPLTSGRTGSRNPEGEGTHAPASGNGATVADAPLPAPTRDARDPRERESESPFEKLWAAWGKKADRHKAKVAYAKLKPDAELHERLVTLAGEWTANYERIGTEKRFQTSLANWLERERYDEDPPEAFVDAREAAVTRSKASGKAKPKGGTGEIGKHGHNLPRGSTPVEIITASFIGDALAATASVVLQLRSRSDNHAGREFEHSFFMAHEDDAVIPQGGRIIGELSRAAGVVQINDTSELVGHMVVANVLPSGEIHYAQA